MALPLYTIASNGGHGFNPHGLSSSKERERDGENRLYISQPSVHSCLKKIEIAIGMRLIICWLDDKIETGVFYTPNANALILQKVF